MFSIDIAVNDLLQVGIITAVSYQSDVSYQMSRETNAVRFSMVPTKIDWLSEANKC